MSKLDEILSQSPVTTPLDMVSAAWESIGTKGQVKALVLGLIEEAREQTLPLGWLTKQIEDL